MPASPKWNFHFWNSRKTERRAPFAPFALFWNSRKTERAEPFAPAKDSGQPAADHRRLRWSAGGSRRFVLILLLITAAAAIPRLVLGASQFIEYDGYWHVFIAQQDNWHNFWADIYSNAHPPLYFLILKAILHFGRSLLIYRSISIVTGVASVALAGWLAREVTDSDVLGALSALAYGMALPAIIVSCEVRSYMLSVFFVLLSFWCLLNVMGSGKKAGNGKARAGFAVAAILACLSHYFAFFYSGAAMAVLFYRFGWDWARGEIANWKRALGTEVATTLPVAVTILTQYKVHAGKLAQIQGHLLPYYYDPHGHETVSAFLLRNWKNFLNLFSPFSISSTAVAIGVFVLGLIGLVIAGDLLQKAGDAPGRRASATMLTTGLMLAAIVLASVAGKYPFGGDLRQQYLLFPFLVLCVAVLLGQAAAGMARFIPSYGRAGIGGLAAIAIIWISVVWYGQYPKTGVNVLQNRIAEFDRLEPKPAAVYVDQFNLITFFIYHHDWRWKFVKLQHPIPGIDVYRLTRGADQMLVFRDKTEWNAGINDTTVYKTLAACLRTEKIPDVSVFDVRQVPPQPPLDDIATARREMVTLAAQSAVCVQKMDVTPVGWYATFRESNCPVQDVEPAVEVASPPAEVSRQPAQVEPAQAKLAQVKGRFDDPNAAIQYVGAWKRATAHEAIGGALISSKDPGAVARLPFYGSEITFVYSKDYDRGIAQVKLDGIARGEIDLYSPKAVWQARTVYRDLRPGEHTIEVIVSGKKNAGSADRIVDVDAFVTR